MIAQTDRLIIRESSGRDFSRIYCMMRSAGEEEISEPVPEDENEALEIYLSYIHTVYSVFGFGLWTVCLKEDPSCIIGRCGLEPCADENSPLGRIELGYLIDAPYRRKGYALEACRAILELAFGALGIEEVCARIHPDNKASAALARRLGFAYDREDLWILHSPRD